ncbi:MAG: hypothetical protein SFW35_05095 [Chitinophagales bacterium]|nr:hypothetical protein [Chitinophagales bacterium]
MQQILREKLWTYIVQNNPDLMIRLQETHGVTKYLTEKVNTMMPLVAELLSESKPQYIIEELCLSNLTKELRPSRFLYIRSVLEEEFVTDYERLRESGTLTYEIINMMEACKDIFDELQFSSENEEERYIRYAIIGQVHDYLN